MEASLFFEQLLNGIQLGVMLFLMAAGLTLIFGIMNFLNLAHGALYMLGAFFAATALEWTGSFLLAIVLGIAASATLGIILDVVVSARSTSAVISTRSWARLLSSCSSTILSSCFGGLNLATWRFRTGSPVRFR